jgi:multicomponent Na+:H+ antiporter subunit D
VLVGSILALVYVWRLIETAYFQQPADADAAPREAPLSMLVPIWLLVAANLYFGVATGLSVGSAREVAGMLMGSGG